eukprot:9467730-Pyramimonas_sp.AAC.1
MSVPSPLDTPRDVIKVHRKLVYVSGLNKLRCLSLHGEITRQDIGKQFVLLPHLCSGAQVARYCSELSVRELSAECTHLSKTLAQTTGCRFHSPGSHAGTCANPTLAQ